MLDMNKGDLIFIPKAPEYGYFTIAEVEESRGYRFENPYGHIIPVKNLRVVANWYNQDSQTICELFQSAYFRGDPLPKFKTTRKKAYFLPRKRLLKKENTLDYQDPNQIREQRYVEGRRNAANSLMEYVNKNWGA